MDSQSLTILTAIGTTLATGALSNAKGPAQAIDDIMELVGFGFLNNLAEKKRIKREQQIDDYKMRIANNMALIQLKDFQEPKLSILGPALEASKYYLEEETLREMFAKIVASSVDSSKNDKLHVSFVEIIKQLSVDDATYLSIIAKRHSTTVAISKIQVLADAPVDNKYTGYLSIPESNIILSDIRLSSFDNTPNLIHDRRCASCIENLNKLNLIEYSFDNNFSNLKIYDIFRRFNTYINLSQRFGENRIDLSKGILSTTQFGQNFISLCVD